MVNSKQQILQIKKYLPILLAIFLISCSSGSDTSQSNETSTNQQTEVTEENIEEVFAELQRTGRPIVLFGLTDKGYAHLGLNFSDIRAYIEQQKAIIAAYEGYYKNAEEALENANRQADSVNKKVDKHNDQPKESFLDKIITPFKK